MSGIDNLKPLTTEKAREIGKLGGIKSGQKKRERKLMSQIYSEFLAKKHKIDSGESITGDELLSYVMSKVLARGDAASVSLLKEIREATEGSKVDLIAAVKTPVQITIEGIEPESTDSTETDTDIQE